MKKYEIEYGSIWKEQFISDEISKTYNNLNEAKERFEILKKIISNNQTIILWEIDEDENYKSIEEYTAIIG